MMVISLMCGKMLKIIIRAFVVLIFSAIIIHGNYILHEGSKSEVYKVTVVEKSAKCVFHRANLPVSCDNQSATVKFQLIDYPHISAFEYTFGKTYSHELWLALEKDLPMYMSFPARIIQHPYLQFYSALVFWISLVMCLFALCGILAFMLRKLLSYSY